MKLIWQLRTLKQLKQRPPVPSWYQAVRAQATDKLTEVAHEKTTK
jgi:hypothetical protein